MRFSLINYLLLLPAISHLSAGQSSGEQFTKSADRIHSSRRAKRIIDGEIVDYSRAPFKAVEYYVWIGHLHNCYEDLPLWRRIASFVSPLILAINFIFHECLEKPSHLLCGGALIAPQIVQTACHCLATSVSVPNGLWTETRYLMDNFDKTIIYMGKNYVKDFDYKIISSHFVIHQMCSRFKSEPQYWRYDIGWVVLEDSVPYAEGVLFREWGRLDYAGPYKAAELASHYRTVLSQMQVCLIVGFGVWQKNDTSLSEYLRFGWITFLGYTECYDTVFKSLGYERLGYFTYNESSSWICVKKTTPPVGRLHAPGDSGSPVTCNNQYVALISGVMKFKRERSGSKEMYYETAIRYAHEANAVEYRFNWENQVIDRGNYFSVPKEDLRVLVAPSELSGHPKIRRSGLRQASKTSHFLLTSAVRKTVTPAVGLWQCVAMPWYLMIGLRRIFSSGAYNVHLLV